MILKVQPASREEAIWLSSRLRPEDRLEVETATGKNVVEVIHNAYENSSECYTLRFNDELAPVALFGVAEGCPLMGVPWLLATPEVVRGSKAIMREARMWLDTWSQKYGTLHNIVDPRNPLHVRWLTSAGCRFGNYVVTVNGHDFLPFFYN